MAQLSDIEITQLGNIAATYSLKTAREVEAYHWTDDEVDWEPKYSVAGDLFTEMSVGYSPSEVAQAAFELRGKVETKAQKSRRLQTINSLLREQDTLDEQSIRQREETEMLLQGRVASKTAQSRKHGREPIPKSVKMYVWQRDQGRCINCGSNEKLEYDHIIPLVKGGSNTDRNIQLLCERCNRSKGSSIA